MEVDEEERLTMKEARLNIRESELKRREIELEKNKALNQAQEEINCNIAKEEKIKQEIHFKSLEKSLKSREEIFDTEKKALQQEKDAVASEKKAVQQEKEVIASEKKVVQQEKELVASEKKAVQQEKEVIASEKKVVQQEKDAVASEKQAVQQEKELVASEKKAVQQEKDAVASEKKAVQQEKEVVASKKKAVQQEKELVASEKKAVQQEKDAVASEKQAVQHEKELVASEKKAVQQEKDAVASEKQAVQQEKELVASEKKAVQHEKELVACEKKAVQHEKELVASEKKAVQHEKELVASEKKALQEEKEVIDTEKNALQDQKKVFDSEQKAFQNQKEAFDSDKKASHASFRSKKQAFQNEKKDVRLQMEAVQAVKDCLADQEKDFQRRVKAHQEAAIANKAELDDIRKLLQTKEEKSKALGTAFRAHVDVFHADRAQFDAAVRLLTTRELAARARALEAALQLREYTTATNIVVEPIAEPANPEDEPMDVSGSSDDDEEPNGGNSSGEESMDPFEATEKENGSNENNKPGEKPTKAAEKPENEDAEILENNTEGELMEDSGAPEDKETTITSSFDMDFDSNVDSANLSQEPANGNQEDEFLNRQQIEGPSFDGNKIESEQKNPVAQQFLMDDVNMEQPVFFDAHVNQSGKFDEDHPSSAEEFENRGVTHGVSSNCSELSEETPEPEFQESLEKTKTDEKRLEGSICQKPILTKAACEEEAEKDRMKKVEYKKRRAELANGSTQGKKPRDNSNTYVIPSREEDEMIEKRNLILPYSPGSDEESDEFDKDTASYPTFHQIGQIRNSKNSKRVFKRTASNSPEAKRAKIQKEMKQEVEEKGVEDERVVEQVLQKEEGQVEDEEDKEEKERGEEEEDEDVEDEEEEEDEESEEEEEEEEEEEDDEEKFKKVEVKKLKKSKIGAKGEEEEQIHDPEVVRKIRTRAAKFFAKKCIDFEFEKRGDLMEQKVKDAILKLFKGAGYEETNAGEKTVSIDEVDLGFDRHNKTQEILRNCLSRSETYKEKVDAFNKKSTTEKNTLEKPRRIPVLHFTSASHCRSSDPAKNIVGLAENFSAGKIQNHVYNSESLKFAGENYLNLESRNSWFFRKNGFEQFPIKAKNPRNKRGRKGPTKRKFNIPTLKDSKQNEKVNVFDVKKGFDHNKLKEAVTSTSICIVRGLGKALEMDLSVFDMKQMEEARGKDHTVEIARQKPQHSTRNMRMTGNGKDDTKNLAGRWVMDNIRREVTLGEFVQNFEKVLQTVREGVDYLIAKFKANGEVTKKDLKVMMRKLMKCQLSLKTTDKEGIVKWNFPIISFATNLDLDEKKKNQFKKQYAVLKKLPLFLHYDEGMFRFLTLFISGINLPQVYYKQPGSRTAAHIENLTYDSVNINVGPGECVWFAVPFEYAAKMEELMCQKKTWPFHSVYWPNESQLRKAGIPVVKFIQKPGDLVYVGTGTYHWVQSNGFTTNVAWNVAQENFEQLASSVLIHDLNMEQRNPIPVPLVSMMWEIAKAKEYTNDEMMTVVNTVLTRSLAICKIEFDVVRKNQWRLLKMSPLSARFRAMERCEKCKQWIFNMIAVMNGGERRCMECADFEERTTCYYREQLEDLMEIFDNYRPPNEPNASP